VAEGWLKFFSGVAWGDDCCSGRESESGVESQVEWRMEGGGCEWDEERGEGR
jgi:hypothetical protein